jgi:hypothetical protein
VRSRLPMCFERLSGIYPSDRHVRGATAQREKSSFRMAVRMTDCRKGERSLPSSGPGQVGEFS